MNIKQYFLGDKFSLIAIRGISVLAKFLFTILFFQFSEAKFGEYSLVATTILLLVFVMGMDFYSYANRAVLHPETNTQKIIFNQFSLYLLLYLLLFPLVYVIFKWEGFNPVYRCIFYGVLITEHLNFEFYRLLFVFKKPLFANINLFFRNGLWVLFATAQIYIYKSIRIYDVLLYWLIGNILALIFSAVLIFAKRHKIDKSNFKWDVKWIKTGLLVSIPYILGTLAYKTIEFSDRYMIDYFLDKKQVGIYSFFANMANVLNIVLFTLVISVLYPLLVESIMKKDKEGFKKYFGLFKKETYIYTISLTLLLSIALPIVLMVIDKAQYLKEFYIFFILSIANVLLNLSFVYHYVIYAYHKDWQILKATAIAAVSNIVLNLWLIPIWGIAGAAVSTLVSFLLILLIKRYDYRRFYDLS